MTRRGRPSPTRPQRDVATVTELAVAAPPNLRFDIFYAVSANRYRWLDSEKTGPRSASPPPTGPRIGCSTDSTHAWQTARRRVRYHI